MIRSWWDQLLIIYIPSLNIPYIRLADRWKMGVNFVAESTLKLVAESALHNSVALHS